MRVRCKIADDRKRNAILNLPSINNPNDPVKVRDYTYKFTNEQAVKYRMIYHRVNKFKKSNNIHNENTFFKIQNNPGNINRDKDVKLYKDKQFVYFEMPKYMKKTNNFEVIFNPDIQKCFEIDKKDPEVKNVKSKYLARSNSDFNHKQTGHYSTIKELVRLEKIASKDKVRSTLIDKYIPNSEMGEADDLKYLMNNKLNDTGKIISVTTHKNFFSLDRSEKPKEYTLLNLGGKEDCKENKDERNTSLLNASTSSFNKHSKRDWCNKKPNFSQTSILDLSDYIEKAKSYGKTSDYPKFDTSQLDFNKKPIVNTKSSTGKELEYYDVCEQDDYLITANKQEHKDEDGNVIISKKYVINKAKQSLEKENKKRERKVNANGHGLNMSVLFTDTKFKEKKLLKNYNEEFYHKLRKKYNNKMLSIDFYKPKVQSVDERRLIREQKLEKHRLDTHISIFQNEEKRVYKDNTKSILDRNIEKDLKRMVEIDTYIENRFSGLIDKIEEETKHAKLNDCKMWDDKEVVQLEKAIMKR